jgi:hypothetical protein
MANPPRREALRLWRVASLPDKAQMDLPTFQILLTEEFALPEEMIREVWSGLFGESESISGAEFVDLMPLFLSQKDVLAEVYKREKGTAFSVDFFGDASCVMHICMFM